MTVKEKETPTKGETTRLAIEDAAVELFMEHGYHATSMRQIAEHAGLALGGIYNHFSSKEELFEAIIIDKHPYKKILPLHPRSGRGDRRGFPAKRHANHHCRAWQGTVLPEVDDD